METSQEHHPNPNKWADLPKDVLLQLIQYLNLKTDVPRLRGVCPSWRSSLPLHELPVHKYYIKVPNINPNDNRPLFLVETTSYLFTPLSSNCGGWVVRFGETGTNKLKLLSPFSDDILIVTEPPITGEINLLECHVHELARPLHLVRELDRNALSISNKVVGERDFTSSEFFSVLVQPRWPQSYDSISVLLLRSGDKKWVEIPCTKDVCDIAFHNGKFFVIFCDCQVGVIDPAKSSTFNHFISAPDIIDDRQIFTSKICLVPSKYKGCLYLVIHMSTNVLMFYLGMKDAMNKWVRVENLGDENFFIGDSVSFVSTSSVVNLNLTNSEPNFICIFSIPFSVSLPICHSSPQMPEGTECLKYLRYRCIIGSIGVFKMESGVSQFKRVPDEDEEVYTRMFVPPPAWVKWRCPSLNNAEVRIDGLPIHDPSTDDYVGDFYYSDHDVDSCYYSDEYTMY